MQPKSLHEAIGGFGAEQILTGTERFPRSGNYRSLLIKCLIVAGASAGVPSPELKPHFKHGVLEFLTHLLLPGNALHRVPEGPWAPQGSRRRSRSTGTRRALPDLAPATCSPSGQSRVEPKELNHDFIPCPSLEMLGARFWAPPFYSRPFPPVNSPGSPRAAQKVSGHGEKLRFKSTEASPG